jgi:hypothetical protein
MLKIKEKNSLLFVNFFRIKRIIGKDEFRSKTQGNIWL